MDLSDETKAGLIDSLGGGILEICKEAFLNHRRQQAMEQRKNMEMELAEARAKSLNQSEPPESMESPTPRGEPSDPTARDEPSARRARTDPQGDDSLSSARNDVETGIAQGVIDQLADMDVRQRRAGIQEVRDLDRRIRDGADKGELKDAMREYDVITPLVAQAE
jgi:hypothetical protein